MLSRDGGEGDCSFVSLELHHHGVEVPCDAPNVGQPWRLEDDVAVVADVEEEGVNLECLCVNAEWYVAYAKNCSYETRDSPVAHS